MCSGQFVGWGVVGLLFGPPMLVWPYKIARVSEMFDAIGRKPSGPVEPADWNVALTRLAGAGLSLLGVGFVFACLL